MSRQHQLHVEIDWELYWKFKAVAADQGKTMSCLFRETVEKVVYDYNEPGRLLQEAREKWPLVETLDKV